MMSLRERESVGKLDNRTCERQGIHERERKRDRKREIQRVREIFLGEEVNEVEGGQSAREEETIEIMRERR